MAEIRDLTHADREGWRGLWRAYPQFYAVAIPEAATGCLWHRLHDPAEPVRGAIAIDGETPAGLAHFLTHRTTWSIADTGYLQDLFVHPALRGQTIGRGLVAPVRAHAAVQGCAELYWLTHETNVKARRLYDRVATRSGFIPYSQSSEI